MTEREYRTLVDALFRGVLNVFQPYIPPKDFEELYFKAEQKRTTAQNKITKKLSKTTEEKAKDRSPGPQILSTVIRALEENNYEFIAKNAIRIYTPQVKPYFEGNELDLKSIEITWSEND